MLDPSSLAADLFEAILVRYTKPDVPGTEALPARQFIAHGAVGGIGAETALNPHGELIVFMSAIMAGSGDGASNTAGQRVTTVNHTLGHRARLHVRLLRPFPSGVDENGYLPEPDTITAASGTLLRDAQRLTEAIHQWAAELPIHLLVTIGNVDTISPAGSLAGWRAAPTVGPL